MIEWLGFRTLRLTDIQFPGHFQAVLNAEVTTAIMNSYELLNGHIQAPVVRKIDSGYRLLAGTKRMAAHSRRGELRVECRVVDCSDDEAQYITDAENAVRFHSPQERDRIIAGMVERAAAIMRDRAPVRTLNKGRAPGPLVRARAQVAESLGIPASTVASAEKRHKAPEPTPDATPESARPSFDMLGEELSDEFLVHVARIQEVAKRLSDRLRAALVTAKHLDALVPGQVNLGDFEALLEHAATLYPHVLCENCKGMDSLQPDCDECNAEGWVSR